MGQVRIYRDLVSSKGSRQTDIVQPYTGRAIPLEPQLLNLSGVRLAEKMNLEHADYIVGFAEQGILPGYAVANAAKKKFVASTRSDGLSGDLKIHFREPHSDYPDQFIYSLQRGSRVALVDDEISSGVTMLNAIDEFLKHDIEVVDIGAFIMAEDPTRLTSLNRKGFQPKFLNGPDEVLDRTRNA